jgi:hypothetical protein
MSATIEPPRPSGPAPLRCLSALSPRSPPSTTRSSSSSRSTNGPTPPREVALTIDDWDSDQVEAANQADWNAADKLLTTRPTRPCGRIRVSGFMERQVVRLASVELDIGRPDHFTPLFCFVGDELAEVGGGERERHSVHVGEPRIDLGIG